MGFSDRCSADARDARLGRCGRMADGQRAELLAPAIEEWLTADHEPACSQFDQACKDRIEVLVGTGIEDMKLQPEGFGRRLQFLRCGLSTGGIGWVDERGMTFALWTNSRGRRVKFSRIRRGVADPSRAESSEGTSATPRPRKRRSWKH